MDILFWAFVAIGAIVISLLIRKRSGSDSQNITYKQQSEDYVDPSQEDFHRKAEREVFATQFSDSRGSKASIPVSGATHERGWIAGAPPVGSGNRSDIELSELLPSTFVVLDLETTGLSPTENEIIEIGAIKFALGASAHDGFQLLLRPRKKIGPKIESLTGITQEMLDRDGLDPDVALKGFSEFIGDLPLVTFNAPFDMGFLWNAGKNHGIIFKNRYACALQLSRKAWPQLPSHRLADLAEAAGLSEEDTHRALADSKRALQIFVMAVTTLGSRVHWERQPIDWHLMVEYNKMKEANQSFCKEARALEDNDTNEAIRLYHEAIDRMYEYETMVDGRYADAYIIDRLSLCLWKMARYQELVEGIDKFVGAFPDVTSSLMTTVLRRRERAAKKANMSIN